MPFHNVHRDPSLDPWRQGFADKVAHWLSSAQPSRFETADTKEVVSALTNGGWEVEQEVSLELAGKVAEKLRCNSVILGEFARTQGLWRVAFRVLRSGGGGPEQKVEVEDRSTHQLLVRLYEKSCAALEVSPFPAGLTLMRDYPIADSTYEKLVRLKDPETKEANLEYIKTVREILASEPNCFSARAELVRDLLWAGQTEEALAESRKLLQQAPGLCTGHFLLAVSLQGPEHEKQRQEEFLAALKVHPGCPSALGILFEDWSAEERWDDLRKVCEQAHQALPAEKSTIAYLAAAKAQLGDRKGADALVSELGPTAEYRAEVHTGILMAGATREKADLGLAAREMLWFQRHSSADPRARQRISELDATMQFFPPDEPNSPKPPRLYSQQEFEAELEKRLTADERALAVSPIALTEQVKATARDLTAGVTNEQLKVALLFAYVAEQRQNTNALPQPTGTGSGQALACHYYASQLVALARAVGIPSWLVHVELSTEGLSGYHDRAALLLGGRLLASDPTWNLLFTSWREEGACRILDDVQAVAHHLCQTSSLPAVRAALKLDPDDVWTRIMAVIKLAQADQLQEAEALWKTLPPESTNRWDYYFSRGILEAEKKDYEASRRSLVKADSMSPNNMPVKYNLGLVYGSLHDEQKAAEYMHKAMGLGGAQQISSKLPDGDTRIQVLGALAEPNNASLDSLRTRAANGDVGARAALVNRLFKQGGQGRDEALDLLRQSAEEGDPVFQENYARNLLLLLGPERAEEAARFFRRAATQGNPEAQYQLAMLLYEGKVVKQDPVEASEWMHLAAEAGEQRAAGVLRELQLFLNSAAFAEGKKKAAEFKAVKERKN